MPGQRGRPPGNKTRSRSDGSVGSELVNQLNAMIAQLISTNRKLQRQVARLSERAGAAKATKGVERRLRTMSRKVKKALDGAPKSRRKAASTSARGRRKTKATATRRRRAA